MPREVTHRYLDPLDAVWLACARRVGLEVVRSPEVFASTDGAGRLAIGTPETLDPDDCLAQMIFHELCHALVQGPERLHQPDWGLDNESERDFSQEHGCLRLQAHLAGALGLRRLLAPTTDFRAYYDALPADPLEASEDGSHRLAREALARVDLPPWAPHLRAALEATAVIARAAAAAGGGEVDGELPSLWRATE